VDPTKDYAGSARKPDGPPVWEGILEAGSVLYMPRGWWHVAVPLDEPTLHVTLGVRAFLGEDVLRWLAAELQSSAVFRANAPLRRDPAAQEAYLSELRDAIGSALSGGCLERVNHFLNASTRRHPAPSLPGSVVPVPVFKPESVLQLSGARRLGVSDLPNGQLNLALNGSQWTCSARLARPVSQLSGLVGRRFSEISAGLPGPAVTELKFLLTAMQLEGRLVVRPPDQTDAAHQGSRAIA
jgi:hypothetical protein